MDWNAIVETIIGSFAGFVLGIALFYITEKWKVQSQRKDILKYLKRELAFDVELLNSWLDDYDKILRQITANDKPVYVYLRYGDFQLSFIQNAFSIGLLYDHLNDEQILKLNTILTHFSSGEQRVNQRIHQWNTDEIPQKEALGMFQYEKDIVGRYSKDFQVILATLK